MRVAARLQVLRVEVLPDSVHRVVRRERLALDHRVVRWERQDSDQRPAGWLERVQAPHRQTVLRVVRVRLVARVRLVSRVRLVRLVRDTEGA